MENLVIAMLGTGVMGAPIARNLARAGHSVRVWNRTHEKAKAIDAPVSVFETAQQAVDGADMVITMLTDGAAVTHVLLGEGGVAATAKSGALFVDMSSIQPSLARDHASLLRNRGLHYLDAPVSGGERGAVEATLAIMVGGERDDYRRAEPVFAALGNSTHVGGAGAGQVAKLANQAIVAVSIGAVAEALLLAQAGGCDPVAVRKALMGGFATSRILELHGERMLERNWVPGGALELHLKDLNNALDVAAATGLILPLTEQARTAYLQLTKNMEKGRFDHAAYLLWLEVQNPGQRLGQGPDINP